MFVYVSDPRVSHDRALALARVGAYASSVTFEYTDKHPYTLTCSCAVGSSDTHHLDTPNTAHFFHLPTGLSTC